MMNLADMHTVYAAASKPVDVRTICATASEHVMEKYYLDPELNPHGYFLRTPGKLPLDKVLPNYITEGGESSRNALIDLSWYDPPRIASEPALGKARKKISLDVVLDYMHFVNE